MRWMRACSVRVIVALVVTLTVTGCWNRSEVNEVAPVSAVAIDRDPDGRVRVTVLLIKPAGVTGDSKQSGGASGRQTFSVTASGGTVFEALRGLNHFVTRTPEYEHNNVIVIAEEVARTGVGNILDFFMRDHEARLDQWILVARGDAAKSMETHFELEPNTGLGLRRLYNRAFQGTGEVVPVRLYEFVIALSSPTTAPVASGLSPLHPDEHVRTSGDRRRIGGAAVFRNDRMVGWLDDRETRSLEFLNGKVASGIVRVPCETAPGDGIGVEVLGSRRRIRPEWNQRDRMPQVRVSIRVTGKLGDLMCGEDLTQPENLGKLKERTARAIKTEVAAVLNRLQQDLGADPIGIGEALHGAYPRQWKDWQSRWDKLYPTIRVVPEVRVDLHRPGTSFGKPLMRSVPTGDGKQGTESR